MKLIISRWTPINLEGSGAGINCFGASKMIFFLEDRFHGIISLTFRAVQKLNKVLNYEVNNEKMNTKTVRRQAGVLLSG